MALQEAAAAEEATTVAEEATTVQVAELVRLTAREALLEAVVLAILRDQGVLVARVAVREFLVRQTATAAAEEAVPLFLTAAAEEAVTELAEMPAGLRLAMVAQATTAVTAVRDLLLVE